MNRATIHLRLPQPRFTRAVLALFVSLGLVAGACSGSADPAPPAASTTTSSAISEADALAKADAILVEQGRSLDGLEASPAKLFGEWQVSYELQATDTLAGGFLVVLDAESGELIEVVEYR